MKANILLIEDDDALAMGLEFLFKQEGMNVTRACDCKSARAAFSGASYDLIVLDITLPDGNGFDLCRDFRASSDTPILFLTALDDELSQVRALDGGGDDYVTKPFALKVLVSRVNALLRRGPVHRAYAALARARGLPRPHSLGLPGNAGRRDDKAGLSDSGRRQDARASAALAAGLYGRGAARRLPALLPQRQSAAI